MADALVSPATGIAFGAASAGLVAAAARRVAREPGAERRLPVAGVLSAFVFAAQMVNFAVPGTGSSGHLVGGLLLAILLGPWAAFLALAAVLLVQALLFADGGLLALGCNAFNLGFWPAFAGLPLYRRLSRGGGRGRGALAAVAAAAVSLELGALGVAVQTALSGRSEIPFGRFALLLAAIHLPVAAVEGLVTAGVVQLLRRLAPDRIEEAPVPAGVSPLAALLAAAFVLAAAAASLASSRPDGLEWSLSRALGGRPPPEPEGIASALRRAQESLALAADRAPPGRSPAAAGLLGSAVVLGLVLGLGLLLRRRTRGTR